MQEMEKLRIIDEKRRELLSLVCPYIPAELIPKLLEIYDEAAELALSGNEGQKKTLESFECSVSYGGDLSGRGTAFPEAERISRATGTDSNPDAALFALLAAQDRKTSTPSGDELDDDIAEILREAEAMRIETE